MQKAGSIKSCPNRLKSEKDVNKPSLSIKSDGELEKIVQTCKKLLTDKTLLQRLPDKGEKLRIQFEQAHKELSLRELIKSSVTKLENLTLQQDVEMQPATNEFSTARSEKIDSNQKPLSINQMNKVRNAKVENQVKLISIAESLLLSGNQLKLNRFPHQPPNMCDETNSNQFLKFRDAEADSDDDLGGGHDDDDIGGGNDDDDIGGCNYDDDNGENNDNRENNEDCDYNEDYDYEPIKDTADFESNDDE